MDDTRQGEDVLSMSEENWLQYFHNLHSNEPLNPTQQNICNELRQNECHGQHCRPLGFMITEREMRKAAEKLRWLDWICLGGYLLSLSIKYVAMSKDMGKRLPQLYYIKMKISYDLAFIAIGVTMAT